MNAGPTGGLRLWARLSMAMGVVVTVVFVTTAAIVYVGERDMLHRTLRAQGEARATLLSTVLAEPLGRLDYQVAQEILSEATEAGVYTIAMDRDGRILAHSARGKRGATGATDMFGAAVLRHFRSPRSLLGRIFHQEVYVRVGTDWRRFREFSTEVVLGSKVIGAVRVGFDTDITVDGPVRGTQRRIALIFLTALAMALATALALARLLARPLVGLAERAASIASGRYDEALPIPASGEIGELTVAFDRMRGAIRDHIRQIEEKNRVLDRKVFELAVLYEVSSTLNYKSYSPELLNYLLDKTLSSLSCEWGSIMLLSDETDDLELRMVRGTARWDPSVRVAIPVGQGIAGLAFEQGQPVVANEGSRDPRFAPVAGQEEYARLVRSIVTVPLMVDQKPIGVLNVVNKVGDGGFSPDDCRLLMALAGQTARALESAKLYAMAIRESKTGLYVQSYFEARVQEQITVSRRFDQRFALLILDVDHFKQVNDRFGHMAGDEVLLTIARFIKEGIRQEIDIASRFGGEEFMLCLPRTDPAGAVVFAERLRKRIADECGREGGPERVTVSIGIAVYPDHARELARLKEAADAALYRAKQEGRDLVRVAA